MVKWNFTEANRKTMGRDEEFKQLTKYFTDIEIITYITNKINGYYGKKDPPRDYRHNSGLKYLSKKREEYLEKIKILK